MPVSYRERFDVPQVKEALIHSGGLLTHAARYLQTKYNRPCSRNLLLHQIKRHSELMQLRDNLREVRLDVAEMRLQQYMDEGSEKSVHFFLARQGRSRGYGLAAKGESQPVEPVQDVLDTSHMTLDEKKELLAIMERYRELTSPKVKK